MFTDYISRYIVNKLGGGGGLHSFTHCQMNECFFEGSRWGGMYQGKLKILTMSIVLNA